MDDGLSFQCETCIPIILSISFSDARPIRSNCAIIFSGYYFFCFQSSYPARQRRCQEILNNPRLDTAQMRKLIKDFNRLWEKLIELSNKPIPDRMLTTTVKALSTGLPRLLASSDFGPIMMPTSKFRQLHLPSKKESVQNHYPFPE